MAGWLSSSTSMAWGDWARMPPLVRPQRSARTRRPEELTPPQERSRPRHSAGGGWTGGPGQERATRGLATRLLEGLRTEARRIDAATSRPATVQVRALQGPADRSRIVARIDRVSRLNSGVQPRMFAGQARDGRRTVPSRCVGLLWYSAATGFPQLGRLPAETPGGSATNPPKRPRRPSASASGVAGGFRSLATGGTVRDRRA